MKEDKSKEKSEYQKQRYLFIITGKNHPCDICRRRCYFVNYPKECDWFI